MKRFVIVTIFSLLAAPVLAEQHEQPAMSAEEQAMMEAYMKAGMPGEPHEKMAATAGKWKATVKSWMGPDEPMVTHGEAIREVILDGRVLKETFTGDFMGTPFHGVSMTGYDNVSGEYWSTWNDSMSTGIMVSHGVWDDEKNGVVFEGTYNDPMIGGAKSVKMITSSVDGKEMLEMWEARGDEMFKTMEMTLVRK